MWRCPKCGEEIEAGFDVCWNCGTAQDGTADAGFSAETPDPAVPDPGPEPEQPEKSAEDDAARLGAAGQRIVEICSAANIIEADGLCELLEEAGIHARVVGEILGAAAGGLPLGEAIAPRVWALEDDAVRAREIIARWRSERETGPIEWPGTDAPPEWETPAEVDEGPLPSDVRFRFLSEGFWIAGGLCIVIGGLWAWQNWRTLSSHPATADGRLIGIHWRDLDTPDKIDSGYAYFVGHKKYFTGITNARNTPFHAPIYYDPGNPAEGIVGPIAPPWVIVAFSIAVGLFLSFVGCQFR